MTADVLPFKSRQQFLVERFLDKWCPWCGQVIYSCEIHLHLACVAEAQWAFETPAAWLGAGKGPEGEP